MERRLRSAWLVCICLVVTAGPAAAQFSPVPSFEASTSNPLKCVQGDQLTNGPCDRFPSRAAGCEALILAVNNWFGGACGFITLAACLDTPVTFNNVFGTSYVEQVVPFACHAGTGVVGQTAPAPFPAICPANSTRPTSSTCVCDTGFVEANSTCSGGDNNGKPCPFCGNPANPANGNKYEEQPVYRGANGFGLSLAFNTYDDYRTRFGRRWRDSFDRRITVSGSSRSMAPVEPTVAFSRLLVSFPTTPPVATC